MTKLAITLMSTFLLFSACSRKAEPSEPQVLSTVGAEAAGPFFTKDHEGNAVLCWTEKNSNGLYQLKYATYNTKSNKFDVPVTVPPSVGCSSSAESMAKVAFKADGTVFALFAKRFTEEQNPYAGAIYYSFSTDRGKHWSEASFLHSDTTHAYGRNFFDIATLNDGEVAAIWLDGRYGKSIKGSALFFSRTEKGTGFVVDTCMDKGTCECCRTDILTDEAGTIHLAYRNIEVPNALADQQIRDMAYIKSADNGRTFSSAETISKDNWEITGCPHSGPSLAANKQGLQATWFTAGGGSGLYHTSTNATGNGFRNRNLLSVSGRHPQMIALNDGRMAVVFEEPLSVEVETVKKSHNHDNLKKSHNHGNMKMSHGTNGAARIILNYLNSDGLKASIALTDGQHSDHHAVLTSVDHTLITAWVRENETGNGVYFSHIR